MTNQTTRTPASDHQAVTGQPVAPPTAPPQSDPLGQDLQRLEHEQQQELDRRRQEALARLRKVQAYD